MIRSIDVRICLALLIAWWATGCGRGCAETVQVGAERAKVGHAETAIWVGCSPSGVVIRNDGDRPRYVNVTSFCTVNSEQIPHIGEHGELEGMVISPYGSAGPPSFSGTIPAGEEVMHEMDIMHVDPCWDYTNAPPGQHEQGPELLDSRGPADALHMHIHITDIATSPGIGNSHSVHVVCEW